MKKDREVKSIQEIIKETFPNLSDDRVKELAKEYLVSLMLEKAKTISEQQMRQEIQGGI